MEELPLETANVTFNRHFLDVAKAKEMYDKIRSYINLDRSKAKMPNGKVAKLSRATTGFGDNEIIQSNVIPKIWGVDRVREWLPEILEIKKLVEKTTKFKYNVCLVNYYTNGKKTIGFHSDREEAGDTKSIASVSLGTPRKFIFERIQTGKQMEIVLNNGSLLVMGAGTQENYKHCIDKDDTITTGRINLTFRRFDPKSYNKY